ncbi:MAG: cation transporter [Phycisphaerales bacterium]|nr:MAG: cation transporter [Phycisphaerales bacterium]
MSDAPDRDSGYVGDVQRVTWAGLVANVLLAILKFVGGILGSSQAIVADAVHTLSDSSTDVAILIGVRYWSMPPDEEHPHGHRRIETVVTSVIALALLLVGAGLLYNALTTLRDPDADPPGWIAFAAAAVSIATKEALYQWTAAVGKRLRSSALTANAWHHRSDALSSVPAALAVGGAALSPNWVFLDHVGAVVVSLFILQAAWSIGRPALGQLIDTGAPKQDRERIRRIALATDGVKHVHALRTRYVGHGLQVDLHIHVDGGMSVRAGHDISRRVKRQLLNEGPDILDVVVHLEPVDDGGSSTRGQPS